MANKLPLSAALAILLAATTVGCVTRARYVEARDALVREQAGHHETTSQLQGLGERYFTADREREEAWALLEERQRRIQAAEQRLAQMELDVNVAAREREEAAELVEQLRGELGRVATHLRAFSDQRDALKTSLDAAEGKLSRLAVVEQAAAQRALVVRDLALALHEPVATGEIELVVVDGRPVLRIPAARLFPAEDEASVTPEGDAFLAAIAQIARLHENATIHVTEAGLVEVPGAPEARLGRISGRLVEHGVERSHVLVAVPPDEQGELAEALGELEPGRVELQILLAES